MQKFRMIPEVIQKKINIDFCWQGKSIDLYLKYLAIILNNK